MSAIAVETTKFESVKYVQQMFDWDAPAPVTREQSPREAVVRSSSTTPSPTQARRGRCEHVGGVMAVVLGKYGLGIDDLLRAIEERQAQVALSR